MLGHLLWLVQWTTSTLTFYHGGASMSAFMCCFLHTTFAPVHRLAERQTPTGGLNGRPEKLPDVCYSWWCLSALAILKRLHWIDRPALTHFILNCQARMVVVVLFVCQQQHAMPQDEEGGGISDRPEDMVDVYHTFFGVAGLSLMGYPGLKAIDPVLALPVEVVARVMGGT